jgi:hypothetical protein
VGGSGGFPQSLFGFGNIYTSIKYVYEVYAHEVHAYELHTHKVHAREVHAREINAHAVHACEMHVYEVYTHEEHACEVHANEGFCEDLARQNTVTHLFQSQLGFRRCRIWVSVIVVVS